MSGCACCLYLRAGNRFTVNVCANTWRRRTQQPQALPALAAHLVYALRYNSVPPPCVRAAPGGIALASAAFAGGVTGRSADDVWFAATTTKHAALWRYTDCTVLPIAHRSFIPAAFAGHGPLYGAVRCLPAAISSCRRARVLRCCPSAARERPPTARGLLPAYTIAFFL